MATLHIEATPGDGLEQYRLQIDDDFEDLPMGSNNKCSIEVDGKCSDKSVHYIYYAILGKIGSSLQLKVSCDEDELFDIPLAVYPPSVIQRGDVEVTL